MANDLQEGFRKAAVQAGALVRSFREDTALIDYLAQQIEGPLLLAPSPSLERRGIPDALRRRGLETIATEHRRHGEAATAGLSGANFGIVATGTVVLESTPEAVRISTTLPEKHFVILDPAKLIEDDAEVVRLLACFHERLPQVYLAYLTGPSRTADIERVLTIGVHGPKQLHILLLEGLSQDPLER